MHVVLEVISGPDAGRKALLRAGQQLRVGRTEWADLSVEHDGQVSSVHFVLEADPTHCTIEDLGSTNGTLLNGSPLAGRVTLGDGDEITAGQTRFLVQIAGAPDQPAAAAPIRETTEQKAAVVETAVIRGPIECAAETCESGVTRYVGSTEVAPPAELAKRLSAAAPLHLIVDFNRLELSVPETIGEDDYLMNWLPEESRTKYSPVVLSGGDGLDLCLLVREAWGKDAVIGVYSNRPKEKLLKRFREAPGAFVRPSILTPQLLVAAPAFVGHLLRNVEAVLVEDDPAERWCVFAKEEIAEKLESLGLPPRNTPEQ